MRFGVDRKLCNHESNFMKRIASQIVAIALLGWASAAVALVHVPSPLSKQAVFVADNKSPHALTAIGEDGARIVVGEAVMITAIKGSRIKSIEKSESGLPHITLVSGGFRVHVGSKPIVLEIAGVAVDALQAELTVFEINSSWTVKIDAVLANGRISAQGVAAQEVVLKSGKVFQIARDTDVKPAPPFAAAHATKIAARLTERPKTSPLQPVAIEDASDLVSKTDASTDNMEIDAVEIEIESDCVEVCIE